MTDLDQAFDAIVKAIGDSACDPAAADDLQARLVGCTGLAIAFHSDGNSTLASLYCDRASNNLYESATAQAALLGDVARMA